jgi:hypothetical protein
MIAASECLLGMALGIAIGATILAAAARYACPRLLRHPLPAGTQMGRSHHRAQTVGHRHVPTQPRGITMTIDGDQEHRADAARWPPPTTCTERTAPDDRLLQQRK